MFYAQRSKKKVRKSRQILIRDKISFEYILEKTPTSSLFYKELPLRADFIKQSIFSLGPFVENLDMTKLVADNNCV